MRSSPETGQEGRSGGRGGARSTHEPPFSSQLPLVLYRRQTGGPRNKHLPFSFRGPPFSKHSFTRSIQRNICRELKNRFRAGGFSGGRVFSLQDRVRYSPSKCNAIWAVLRRTPLEPPHNPDPLASVLLHRTNGSEEIGTPFLKKNLMRASAFLWKSTKGSYSAEGTTPIFKTHLKVHVQSLPRLQYL